MVHGVSFFATTLFLFCGTGSVIDRRRGGGCGSVPRQG